MSFIDSDFEDDFDDPEYDLSDVDGDYEEDWLEDDNSCTQCNGSGEGSHDGSTCNSCRGSGSSKRKAR
jgi:DnaJ-class molecular chaperone